MGKVCWESEGCQSVISTPFHPHRFTSDLRRAGIQCGNDSEWVVLGGLRDVYTNHSGFCHVAENPLSYTPSFRHGGIISPLIVYKRLVHPVQSALYELSTGVSHFPRHTRLNKGKKSAMSLLVPTLGSVKTHPDLKLSMEYVQYLD